MYTFPIPTQAMSHIQSDIVGPIRESKNGNKYIVTFIDTLTKYFGCVPVKDITAKTVAEALSTELICRHGSFEVLHTDQGSNFLSKLMEEWARIFKIKKIKSTAFHLSLIHISEPTRPY